MYAACKGKLVDGLAAMNSWLLDTHYHQYPDPPWIINPNIVFALLQQIIATIHSVHGVPENILDRVSDDNKPDRKCSIRNSSSLSLLLFVLGFSSFNLKNNSNCSISGLRNWKTQWNPAWWYQWYRWPNGPGPMGRHGNGPKKHGPRTAQHGGVRASGRPGTIVGPCLGRHLGTAAQHGHDTKLGRPDVSPSILAC
jgi:hypothetical protein